MKKFRKLLALGMAALLLAGLAGCTGEADPDVIRFAALGEALTGTAQLTKEGAVLDSSSRTPSASVALGEALSLTGRGIFALTLRNTSDAEKLVIDFITAEDDKYTPFKRFELPLQKTEGFQKLTVDLSGQYGWLGHLCGLRITAEGLNEGQIVLQSLAAEEGGEHYIKGLKFEDTKVYLTARDRMTVKNIQYGPDGIVGSWRDDQGNINYIGSSAAGGVSGAFVTTGTPDDPFKTVRYAGKRVEGVDWATFCYCSIAQVVKDPATGTLIGITHLERKTTGGIVAALGLSVSKDNGETWTLLGEIIQHDFPIDQRHDVNRDIGNGPIVMDDTYLYIFVLDNHEADLSGGVSVARVELAELFAKVAAGELPTAYKYKDGQWNEPGMGGGFTSVLPQDVTPNFLYITYNTVLKKYIMVTCQAPYYQSNDGDILLMVSDDFLDWTNAERQWLATGYNGEQYPSIFSDAENCQTESGETFYIYWCDWNARDDNGLGMEPWQLLWTSAQYMCCKVTVTG